jgi:hypothetical protein
MLNLDHLKKVVTDLMRFKGTINLFLFVQEVTNLLQETIHYGACVDFFIDSGFAFAPSQGYRYTFR